MARTSDGSREVAEVRKLHDKIYRLMDVAVERRARLIMLEHPLAREYVQAMGTWFFTVEFRDVDGRVKRENVSDGKSLAHFSDPDWTDPETSEALEELGEAIDAFGAEIMQTYNDTLEGRYSPMRFTARGKLIENW